MVPPVQLELIGCILVHEVPDALTATDAGLIVAAGLIRPQRSRRAN